MASVNVRLTHFLRRLQSESAALSQLKFASVWIDTPYDSMPGVGTRQSAVTAMSRLWQTSSLRVAADGAADRLADYGYVPEIVIGDMDSFSRKAELFGEAGSDQAKLNLFSSGVLDMSPTKLGTTTSWRSDLRRHLDRTLDHQYLAKMAVAHLPDRAGHTDNNGPVVIWNPDQDSTDLEKALGIICSSQAPDGIAIVGQFSGIGGRLDHTFQMANILYRYSLAQSSAEAASDKAVSKFNKIFNHTLATEQIPIVAVSAESMMFCLPSGRTVIPLRPHITQTQREQLRLGIVPFAADTVATTSGLRWNLNSDVLRWGQLISCCNQVDESNEEIIVNLSQPALWTQNVV